MDDEYVPTPADIIAAAWDRGAQAMEQYRDELDAFMTWEGMHRGKPERPRNPYRDQEADRGE